MRPSIWAFVMLEPLARKLAYSVLREEGGREAPDLPGGMGNNSPTHYYFINYNHDKETIMKTIYRTLIILFLSFALGLPAFAQQAKVKKITNDIYAISLDYYQSLVVIGDKGVLITDPANSYRAQNLKTEILKLTKLPVTHVVLSHEHYDHVGGTEVFPKAKIYAQSNTKSVFKLDVSGQAPKNVDQYFDEKHTISMGKSKVDLHHYAAGDGVGTVIVHLPKESVVYSADMYAADEIINKRWISDSNFLGNRLILNKIVKLKPKYAITTHSESIDPKHLIIGANYYNDLYDAVAPKMLSALKEGFPAIMQALKDLPVEIKLEKYKNFKNYEDLPKHVERMAFSIFHGG